MKPMMAGGVQQTLNLSTFWKTAPGLLSSCVYSVIHWIAQYGCCEYFRQ